MKIHLLFAAAVLAALPTFALAADEKKAEEPKITITGFVDGYYSSNANAAPTFRYLGVNGKGQNAEQPLRNFDFRDKKLQLSQAEVVVEKKIGARSNWGLRLDLNGGPTTDFVHLGEPSGHNAKYFQQAYASYALRRSGEKDIYTRGTIIDVGKFVTHMGFETIESKDNWNYTRGLLFSWAIPYYHTGARLTARYSDENWLQLSAVQGWNNIADNNGNKTFGGQWGWTMSPKWTFIQNVITGNEAFATANFTHSAPGATRTVFDSIVTYASCPKTTWAVNFDHGTQQKAVAGTGAAQWVGVSGYVKHTLGPRLTLSGRAELLKDRDGFATGLTGTHRGLTGTVEYKSMKRLSHRFEVRQDWSTSTPLTYGGSLRSSQTSFLLGTVYTF